MKPIKRVPLPAIWLSLLLACACSPAAPGNLSPAPGSSATHTSLPVASPSPSRTTRPTDTATPVPTALVASTGQVVFSESFSDRTFPFNVYGPYDIKDGVLLLERDRSYQPAPDMWPTGGLYGTRNISPGETTVMRFKVSGDINFSIGYHTGVYAADSLRRFNYSSDGSWDLYEGASNSPVKQWPAGKAQGNTWYYFSIRRSADGVLDASLWQASQPPESAIRFHANLGAEWGTLPLNLVIDFRWGAFLLDEYQDIQ